MPAARASTDARVRSLTTTEAAVLALLAIEGERSAYDLTKLVAQAIAHVWSPARSGLYAVLPRLVTDGLAHRRVVTQSPRPEKQLYRITREGRDALREWFETVEPGARESFFLKLFVGGLTTPEVLLEHIAQFREDTEARLDEYRAIEPTNTNRGHDWYHRHLLRLGIERGRARAGLGRGCRACAPSRTAMRIALVAAAAVFFAAPAHAATTSWLGTYTLPAGSTPVEIAVSVSGATATVALGPGHSASARVRIAIAGSRLRFAFPGLPANVAFNGRVAGRIASGTVTQGALRGTFRLARGSSSVLPAARPLSRRRRRGCRDRQGRRAGAVDRRAAVRSDARDRAVADRW